MKAKLSLFLALAAASSPVAAEQTTPDDALFLCTMWKAGSLEDAGRLVTAEERREFAISVVGGFRKGDPLQRIEVFDPKEFLPRGSLEVTRKVVSTGDEAFFFSFDRNPQPVLLVVISKEQNARALGYEADAVFAENQGICALHFGPGFREVFEDLEENGFGK